MPRRKRFPITRLGLTLIIASIFVSIIRFYVDMGARAADFNADIPDSAGTLAQAFRDTFLFRGYIASLLMYAGCALLLVSFLRNITAVQRR